MKTAKIVLRPVVTEKSLASAKNGRYVFRVDSPLSKGSLRQAIESTFKVKVARLSSLRVKGERKKSRRGQILTKPGWKKVSVTLRQGKIDLFEKA